MNFVLLLLRFIYSILEKTNLQVQSSSILSVSFVIISLSNNKLCITITNKLLLFTAWIATSMFSSLLKLLNKDNRMITFSNKKIYLF